MLEEYWGLESKPFLNNPDLDFLFRSTDFNESYARLIYGLKELRGGIGLITGEIGCGKTTLCRAIFRDLLEDDYPVALIINPRLTQTQLLKTIAQEFGVEKPGRSKAKVLNKINELLVEGYENERTPILLIDEAQLLTKSLLEEIRLLTNFETSKQKLIQIVLFGQPELTKKIKRLPQFKQRVAIRYHLGMLDLEETTNYIKHRLDKSGCEREIFTKGAYKKIFDYTKGIPRIINTVSMNALFAGYLQKKDKIDARLIDEVYTDFYSFDG